MPVAEFARAFSRMIVSGEPCVMAASFLDHRERNLSRCLQVRRPNGLGLGSSPGIGRAGFFRIPLKLFLLCRGEGRWGTGERFSVAHPTTDALRQRIDEIVDGQHHCADHEQSQYEGQLYINGHARYSIEVGSLDRLGGQISNAFSAWGPAVSLI